METRVRDKNSTSNEERIRMYINGTNHYSTGYTAGEVLVFLGALAYVIGYLIALF
jgi:hypothetical protein